MVKQSLLVQIADFAVFLDLPVLDEHIIAVVILLESWVPLFDKIVVRPVQGLPFPSVHACFKVHSSVLTETFEILDPPSNLSLYFFVLNSFQE